ncbi:MAG TPA: hypothetical protein VFW24_05340 [Acidimicrobiales bacterium]|nr:hypothetical protein [Acidimicrobiales bacterium]
MPPTDPLQEQLRDLLCLAVVGDHVRWVLRGPGAPELAAWLAQATAVWRADADVVALHLAGTGVPPDGRVRSLALDTPWNWVPDGWLDAEEGRQLMAERLGRLAAWANDARLRGEPGPAHRPHLQEIADHLRHQLETLGRLADACQSPGGGSQRRGRRPGRYSEPTIAP